MSSSDRSGSTRPVGVTDSLIAALALPIAVALLVTVLNPDYMSVLWKDPRGHYLIAAALTTSGPRSRGLWNIVLLPMIDT